MEPAGFPKIKPGILYDAMWQALAGKQQQRADLAEAKLLEVISAHEQALSDVLDVFEMFANTRDYDRDLSPRRLQTELRDMVRKLRVLEGLRRMSSTDSD